MASIENVTRREYSASKASGGGGVGTLAREGLTQVTVLELCGCSLSNGLMSTKSEVSRKLTAALTGTI